MTLIYFMKIRHVKEFKTKIWVNKVVLKIYRMKKQMIKHNNNNTNNEKMPRKFHMHLRYDRSKYNILHRKSTLVPETSVRESDRARERESGRKMKANMIYTVSIEKENCLACEICVCPHNASISSPFLSFLMNEYHMCYMQTIVYRSLACRMSYVIPMSHTKNTTTKSYPSPWFYIIFVVSLFILFIYWKTEVIIFVQIIKYYRRMLQK